MARTNKIFLIVFVFFIFILGSYLYVPKSQVRAESPDPSSASELSLRPLTLRPARDEGLFDTDRTVVKLLTPNDPENQLPLIELRSMLNEAVKAQEAERSRVIAEYAHEGNKIILVAVDLPTKEQVKFVRSEIASLMSACRKSELEVFDSYVDEVISEFDPFGLSGRKALLVTISDEGQHPHTSALVFPVSNFEGLPEALDPKNSNAFKAKRARWYQNPKGDRLERMSHLME